MGNFIALLPLYPRIQLCTDPGAMSHGWLLQSIPDNAKQSCMQMKKWVDGEQMFDNSASEILSSFQSFSGNYC